MDAADHPAGHCQRKAAREAKHKHHVIEQFKNEQLSLWGESAALYR